mmetsp:Transcript_10297/g.24912  ORF Transcript_10297/g.24912 Transcript_10297/m.24912 type:complete len:309 (+) Transcript_10297:2-928(+)
MVGSSWSLILQYFLDRQARTLQEQLEQEEDLSGADHSERENYLASIRRKQARARGRYVTVSLIVVIIVSAIGTCFFHLYEGQSVVDSFYLTTITITGVGFGELVPLTREGRIFAIFYMGFGVLVTINFAVVMANFLLSTKKREVHRKILQQKLEKQHLREMDRDGDGVVTELEYLMYMLIKLQKVDKLELEEILVQFRKHDVDGSGTLTFSDLKKIAREETKRKTSVYNRPSHLHGHSRRESVSPDISPLALPSRGKRLQDRDHRGGRTQVAEARPASPPRQPLGPGQLRTAGTSSQLNKHVSFVVEK